jgi:hypothetical protein
MWKLKVGSCHSERMSSPPPPLSEGGGSDGAQRAPSDESVPRKSPETESPSERTIAREAAQLEHAVQELVQQWMVRGSVAAQGAARVISAA